MADLIFEDPRLVAIYDYFDGERNDLAHYLLIARELKAKSIVDIGCGTGCFACSASSQGFQVTAMDPAQASLDFARAKPHAEKVHWVLGDATVLPDISVDLAVMTGNVAQVFLTDEAWEETLRSTRRVLTSTGHLVFEVRDPQKQAWLDWTPEKTRRRHDIPKIGEVEGWCEVTDVSGEFVSFRWTYTFRSDGQTISSESTLRFRHREAIEASLRKTGYIVHDVRDAPDRPGKEFVFVVGVSA